MYKTLTAIIRMKVVATLQNVLQVEIDHAIKTLLKTSKGKFTHCATKERLPPRKISMGSDRNKIEPISMPIFCSSLNLWSATRMIKSWSIFNFFGLAVWIIQDGKSPVWSNAYFPDGNRPLSGHRLCPFNTIGRGNTRHLKTPSLLTNNSKTRNFARNIDRSV